MADDLVIGYQDPLMKTWLLIKFTSSCILLKVV